MDDEIAVIAEHPLALAVAFDAHGTFAAFLQLQGDFIGDGLDLAGIGAGANDEKICERRDLCKVQYFYLGGFFRFGGAHRSEPVRLFVFVCAGTLRSDRVGLRQKFASIAIVL